MAYATKYRIQFVDTENNSKELLIRQNNYVGSILDIDGGEAVVTYKLEGSSDDVFSELKAASIEIQLYSETLDQYSEFNNFSELDYLVQYKVNNVVKLLGYLVPLNFSQPYDNGWFVITITAIDGIGFLKNRPFPVTSGRMSLINIISSCLAYTTHALDIAVSVNVYELNQTAGRSLEDTYFDTAAFAKNEQTAWNCAEVLSEILKLYTARIQQRAGRWLIYNIETIYVAPYTAQLYNAAAQRLGTVSIGNALSIGTTVDASHVCLLDGGTITKLQPVREAWVKQDYGKQDQAFLINGDFEKWAMVGDPAVLQPEGWTPQGVTIGQLPRDNGSALLIYGTDYNASNYVRFSRDIDASTDPYTIEFEAGLIGLESSVNFADLTVQVSIVSGVTTYYPNTADNEWSLIETAITISNVKAFPSTGITLYKFSRKFDYMPMGTLVVKLYQAEIKGGAIAGQISGACFDNLKVYPVDTQIQTGVTYIHGTTNSNYNAALQNVETKMADAPAVSNSTSLYKNYLSRNVDGTLPTALWTSSYGNFPINVTRMYNILNQYSKPLNRITCTVIGAVYADSILSDHNAVKYLVASISCNERDNQSSVDLIELVAPNTATISISTSDYPTDPETGGSGSGGSGTGTSNPKDNKVAIADEFGGELSPPSYLHPDYFEYETSLGQIHRIKTRQCAGILSDLVTNEISVVFPFEFTEIPVGRKNIHVYRLVEPETGLILDQDVLFNSLVVTTTGFTLTIDASESLTGVIVEYFFTPQNKLI